MAARSLRPTLLVLGTAVIAATLQLTGVLAPVSQPVLHIVEPILLTINRAGLATYRFVTLANPRHLTQQNAALQAQVASLTRENSTLATRAQEAQALGELDRALKPLQLPTVIARILTRSTDPASPTMTIDRGTKDGVNEGDAVLSGAGFIIGRVVTVTPSVSQMVPLSDSRSRITVVIQTGSETFGQVVGDRGLRLLLTNVKRDTTLTAGMGVITAGVDPGVPRGIPVGSLEQLTTKSADLFQTGTVLPGSSEITAGPVAVVILPR